MRCRENGIEHRFTRINHPWTNGQVERMNRTIKDATVKRYHYDSHDQLERHLDDFVSAYNFGRRLKTLKGLTPYEFICKRWTSEPERFRLDPIHQMPGLNTALHVRRWLWNAPRASSNYVALDPQPIRMRPIGSGAMRERFRFTTIPTSSKGFWDAISWISRRRASRPVD